ncbi:MAG: hypothetical protein PHT69_14410 [Bacteroidales bacterium]|nr:hypothetical protein [Bacteroidales bacterium]
MNILKGFIVLLLLLFLTQCGFFNDKTDEKPLAKVQNEYLYLSDIKDIVPFNMDPQDSISFVKNYVNNWVQNKLILNTAESNLKPEQKDFEKQLTDYRNSLIIYTYENELVRQKLDTIVSEEDISKYYEENSQNFLLKDNIVKVIYVKTPLRTPNLNKIKSLYVSDDEEDLVSLRDICEREAVNYFMEDAWLVFSDLLREIPIKTYNEEVFLRSNQHITMQDSLYNYFLNIKGYKIKESISPLSLEIENIRNIIINKRKIELIKKTHSEIFKDALEKGSFEIFMD